MTKTLAEFMRLVDNLVEAALDVSPRFSDLPVSQDDARAAIESELRELIADAERWEFARCFGFPQHHPDNIPGCRWLVRSNGQTYVGGDACAAIDAAIYAQRTKASE